MDNMMYPNLPSTMGQCGPMPGATMGQCGPMPGAMGQCGPMAGATGQCPMTMPGNVDPYGMDPSFMDPMGESSCQVMQMQAMCMDVHRMVSDIYDRMGGRDRRDRRDRDRHRRRDRDRGYDCLRDWNRC